MQEMSKPSHLFHKIQMCRFTQELRSGTLTAVSGAGATSSQHKVSSQPRGVTNVHPDAAVPEERPLDIHFPNLRENLESRILKGSQPAQTRVKS